MFTTIIIVLIIIVVIATNKKCECCGSADVNYSSRYTRGYNELCRQAYGDNGYYCNDCGHVTFITSLEDHKKTLPDWCKPYR